MHDIGTCQTIFFMKLTSSWWSYVFSFFFALYNQCRQVFRTQKADKTILFDAAKGTYRKYEEYLYIIQGM